MKTHKPLPSITYLNECFDVDCLGVMRWKVRPQHHFKSAPTAVLCNRIHAGKIVGRRKSPGYWWLVLNKQEYACHRVIYAMATGTDPGPQCIDHINGDPSDNRPSNLRVASYAQNSQHHRKARVNTSGVVGVSYHSHSGKWQARVSVGDRRKFLGLFANKEDAATVATAARRAEYGAFFKD